MSYTDYLKELLRPLGVYDVDAPFNGGELTAAGEALDQGDQEKADGWSRIQDRYFKQARACANDMGLTVTSRCRLVVPGAGEQEEPENQFLQLIQGGASHLA